MPQNTNVYASLLGSISQTAAVGVNQEDYRPFNDLVDHGKFPVEQNIERITKIEIWAGDRVYGIQPTYELKDGSTSHPLHGRKTSSSEYYSADILENQWIVGVFGRRDTDKNIGSLSLVVFEADKGRVTVQGPWGSPPNPGTSFGTFGQVIALAGTDENSFGLCSISIVKDSSQGGPILLA
uniref:Jacalin-related lectin n=1 Tax=Flammulina velutipes TaxID=38945 RepID=A0A0U3C0U2_FLAVE|nr:jacalin-related lectin [Flammulina velutipes]